MTNNQHCPRCDATVDASAQFCDHCRFPLSSFGTATQVLNVAPPRRSSRARVWWVIGVLVLVAVGFVVGQFVLNTPTPITAIVSAPTNVADTALSDAQSQMTAEAQRAAEAQQAATIQAVAVQTAHMQAAATVQAIQAVGTAQAQMAATVQVAQATATAAVFQATETAQAFRAQQANATARAEQEQAAFTATAQTVRATATTPTPLPEPLSIAEATASSFRCTPAQVSDGNIDFGWCSAEGESVGSWLQITLPAPQVVTGMTLYTNAKDNEPKDVTLILSDGSTQKLQLKRVSGWQNYELTPMTTSSIRVVIDSTNDKKANDVYIAEIKMFGR